MCAEGCAGGVCLPWRCARGGVAVGAAACRRRVAPEGRAVAPQWGCARGGRRYWTAACPGRPSMWAEGRAGGVCHSPAEGARQRGHRCWAAAALGGLLCGRRVAPEGCAIALPRGCAGGVRRRAPLLGAAACPGRPP